MPTYTELKKAVFYAHERPEMLADILKDVVDITPEVYAQKPTFALTTPAAGDSNTIEGGGEDMTVEVNVANTTSSVVITATNKSGQTFAKSGTNQDKVTIGGSGTALTVTVDTSEIASAGGTYKFNVTVKESGAISITYTFVVNVAAAE